MALLLSSLGHTQPLKPGEWRTYTSMRSVSDLALSSDSIYVWAATGGGVFRADLRQAEAALLPLRTTDGLTENDVTAIAADATGNIYIGEGAGGFDIYNSMNGSMQHRSDIRNANYASEGINGITVAGKNVYLATAYGISVYLPKDSVFGATATQFASLPQQDSVRQVLDDGTFVYGAMHEGVVWARNTSDLHASTNWTFLPDSGGSVRALASFRGNLYAGAENGLFMIAPNRNALVFVPLQDTLRISRLMVANDSLYVLDEFGVLYATQDLIHLSSRAISTAIGSAAAAISFRPNNGPIVGSVANGVSYSINGGLQTNLYPSGPIVNSTNFVHFSTATDRLYETNLSQGFGIFRPDSDTWQDFESGVGSTPSARYYKVFYDSIRNVTWLSTYGSPLYKVAGLGTSQPVWTGFDHTEIPNFDNTAGDYIVSSGMMLDANNNFVVTAWAGNGKGLCISTDGVRFSDKFLTHSDFQQPWGCVTQDLNGNYWVGTEPDGAISIGVYWYNPSNNACGVFPGGSGGRLGPAAVGTEYVNAILTDQDDGIWCGTEGGVEIISDPESILQNNQPPTSIRSVQFTANQIVHSMVVDGVGNKWVGTENGIFVVSADGSDSIAHFTAENSPLVDDRVISIAIDPTRGEAYAGTLSGISRFSTIFKRGQPDYTGIRVYPNPVVQTAEISPTVYIDGLVAGSTVQIFSIAGKLIATIDGSQLGSTVIWNGRDAAGHQVPSGLYLVSATSPQASGNGETKMTIVRKPSN